MSLVSLFRRPEASPRKPVPFLAGHERLSRIAAVWRDGRCLVARGYERDNELREALAQLQQKKRVRGTLRITAVTLAEIDHAWGHGPGNVRERGATELSRTAARIFREAALARASDVIFELHADACQVFAIVNDAKLRLGHPLMADEGAAVMGYLFHSKDEGSSQTSYQRGEFQGFSIRSGGTVDLPASVSGLRCQRGPNDPDGDHMFARLFYRDQLQEGTTLEHLGFGPEDAAMFAELRMSRHGGIFLGGSTGDGKSTTLAVNLALQMSEHGGELNLVTLEDPVEYRIPGAVQIAVPTSGSGDERALHFRKALMHFCRIHPASGMVSEIRDHDAAGQVLQFIDTGHQVWTTIHVDSANAILFRLLDMGVEPATLAKPGNIRLLMKQTLLPMLCPSCALDRPPDDALPAWMTGALEPLERVRFRNREGCRACRREDANDIARAAWTGYTRQQVVAESILPDAGYLAFVARRDPIGARDWWIEKMGGRPLSATIWEIVGRGAVDPMDALAKGARPADITRPPALVVVSGSAP